MLTHSARRELFYPPHMQRVEDFFFFVVCLPSLITPQWCGYNRKCVPLPGELCVVQWRDMRPPHKKICRQARFSCSSFSKNFNGVLLYFFIMPVTLIMTREMLLSFLALPHRSNIFLSWHWHVIYDRKGFPLCESGTAWKNFGYSFSHGNENSFFFIAAGVSIAKFLMVDYASFFFEKFVAVFLVWLFDWLVWHTNINWGGGGGNREKLVFEWLLIHTLAGAPRALESLSNIFMQNLPRLPRYGSWAHIPDLLFFVCWQRRFHANIPSPYTRV